MTARRLEARPSRPNRRDRLRRRAGQGDIPHARPALCHCAPKASTGAAEPCPQPGERRHSRHRLEVAGSAGSGLFMSYPAGCGHVPSVPRWRLPPLSADGGHHGTQTLRSAKQARLSPGQWDTALRKRALCRVPGVSLCAAGDDGAQEDLVGLGDVVGLDGPGPAPRRSRACRSSLRSWWRNSWAARSGWPRVPR